MSRVAYLKIETEHNETRQYTNSTAAAIDAGTPVKIDISSTQCIAGVAIADIAVDATGMIDCGNVYAFPCGAAQSFAEGDIVYYNDEGSNAIPAADANGTDDFVLGTAYKASTGSFVWVSMNYGPTAFTRNSSSSSSSSTSA